MGSQTQRELEAKAARRRELKSNLDSRRDPLTGLFDRHAWEEFASSELGQTQGKARGHHIFSIDLDQIRAINETGGREAGDQMIRAAAEVISVAVRDSDFIARWGGDEFAVLLLDSPADSAMRLKARIHASLFERGISASIGMETTRGHGSLHDAWSAADQKMLAEKRLPCAV